MSLSNASIILGGTLSVSGGSAVTFSSLGNNTDGTVMLYVPADTDLRLRRKVNARVNMPKPSASAPNGYTQARGQMVFYQPILLANGLVTVNTYKVEAAYDIETSVAKRQEGLDFIGACAFDTDFTPVFKELALS